MLERIHWLDGIIILMLVVVTNMAPDAFAEDKIPVYFNYHISDHAIGPFTLHRNHPLIDAALIKVKWFHSEPARGRFDWSVIEQKVSQWTVGGKQVLIKVAPYDQDPIAGDPDGDNTETPQWVYDLGVPRITFKSGGVGKGRLVSVPKAWDPRFYEIYKECIKALAEKFDSDPRIAGIKIGIGHNGQLIAQPSKYGNTAFQQAGWTLPLWEQHTYRVIDIFVKHFKTKPVFLRFTQKFLRDFPVSDNLEVAQRIVRYAAEHNVSIMFGGLDPSGEEFKTSGVRELVSYLGTLRNLPSDFSIGFMDDWPLWVPPERSRKCPGPTCGRDIGGFEQALQYAFDVWDGIDRTYPIFFVFLEPEASATNPNSPKFNQDVYEVAVKSLLRKKLSPE